MERGEVMKKLGLVIVAIAILAIAMNTVMAAWVPPEGEQQKICTVRIYSDMFGAGAGAWVPGEPIGNAVTDPGTGIKAEQQPYTDVYSIFFPQTDESPRKDFITFNPIFISEIDDVDKSELNKVGLADQIMHDGSNANEKVFFRMWYEPDYLDKDTDVSGWVSYRINPGPNGALETGPRGDDVRQGNFILPGPDGVLDSIPGDEDGDGAIDHPDTDDFIQPIPSTMPDEHYPAIVQEFTYMLIKPGSLSSDSTAVSGQPGEGTAFVFPVGIKEELFWDPYGYGLTSLDPTLDGKNNPTVVEIQTEQSLASVTGIQADFDGDGQLDPLDRDGRPLSGDELVILTPPTLTGIKQNDMVQFLDHAIVVKEVYTSPPSIKLGVYYTGDLEPKFIGDVIIRPKDMVLVGTKAIFTYLPAGGNNLGQLPKGPFFIYVDSIDRATNSANIKIGRALGATHSAMEQAPGVPDQTPGDPWWLKRFYVDGHEYNVVAIYSDPENNEGFKFITIRTPIPKPTGEEIDLLIEQHSVRLQEYGPNDPLSVMPPYNYEHTELMDVEKWDADVVLNILNCDLGVDSACDAIKEPGYFVGEPYLAKPIYHTTGTYKTMDGRTIQIDLTNLLFYVEEAAEPELKGELKELYNENGDEYWYVEQFWSKPDLYTEFYLPVDGYGENNRTYLVTLNYGAPEEGWVVEKYIPTGEGGPGCHLWDAQLGGRVKFWYDPAECGKKLKNESGVRLYGASYEESQYILALLQADVNGIDGSAPNILDGVLAEYLQNLTPEYPIDVNILIRAGDNANAITDPITGEFVEDLPYTNVVSIFNPEGLQAYPKDILTIDPAWMDEYWADDELKDLGLYAQISIEGNDAREKVFTRMWYEPFHWDKNIDSDDKFDLTDEWYPAIMEEYTYMLIGVDSQPAHGQPGETTFAFPIGTEGWQLDDAYNSETGGDTNTTDGDDIWGYGLTTFDPFPYNGVEEAYAVTVHSERTLADYTGIRADFDGDGILDPLDRDGRPLSGDELVIFTVTLNMQEGERAQFLDYMVEVVSVTDTPPTVTLKFYKLGDTDGKPKPMTPTRSMRAGEMVTLYLDRVNPIIPAGGNNLNSPMTEKGPWFVYVNAINPGSNKVALTLGRALGATHTAMEDDNGEPDMTPGDPWYLKRFYVDGIEYNVVAIITAPADAPGVDESEFKAITIRVPVQKVSTFIDQHSFRCQDYFIGDKLYVMPPFNYEHTARIDIQDGWLPPEYLNDPLAYMGPIEKKKAPLNITIVDEGIEWQFLGILKEIYQDMKVVKEGVEVAQIPDMNFQTWDTLMYWAVPFRYTELKINEPDEKYLIKKDWTAPQGIFQTVNFDNDDDVRPAPFPQFVKFWYDPNDETDLYINTRTIGAGTIEGEVWDVAHRHPIYQATVTISNETWSDSTQTDIAGHYIFTDLVPGTYTLTATKEGYDPEPVNVTLLSTGTTTVDFTYNDGLVPVSPDLNYVLECIKLWYNGQLTMDKVLHVISNWARTL